MRKIRTLFLLLACFSILFACSPQAAAPSSKVSMTFMAGYKPQANLPFVGVYVAKEKGYFDAEGLEVTIQHSPGKGEHLQLLAAGKIQVTTQDAAVLLKRRADPGLPLVSIALIGQRGQQAFAALKESGIQTPKDWEGKIIGYRGTPPPDLFAIAKAAQADINKMQLVNAGFDVRVLTEKKVDVLSIFKSNEPYLLKKWGFNLNLWEAEQFGVPSLGLCYVTSEEILSKQPQMLTKFLRAALKGIAYARENPQEAIEITMKYAGPEADPEHQRYMLETELADAQNEITQTHGIGWQTKEQWQALANMLQEYDAMPAVDVTKAFTTQLLEAANKP